MPLREDAYTGAAVLAVFDNLPNGTTPTTHIHKPQIGKLANGLDLSDSGYDATLRCSFRTTGIRSKANSTQGFHPRHARRSVKPGVGQSNQYNVERLQARHFIDTGIECGLSRKVINQILESTRDEATACVEKTLANLPKGFDERLAGSIAAGVKHRLQRLNTGG